MAAQVWKMSCGLLSGAFSGEIVFEVKTIAGELYQGISPKHYAEPDDIPSREEAVPGTIRVRVLKNGGGSALVRTPDGEAITVPANLVHA